jgi:hypothetical protein
VTSFDQATTSLIHHRNCGGDAGDLRLRAREALGVVGGTEFENTTRYRYRDYLRQPGRIIIGLVPVLVFQRKNSEDLLVNNMNYNTEYCASCDFSPFVPITKEKSWNEP